MASLLGKAPVPKLLWLAIPILILAAIVMLSQRPLSSDGKVAAPDAQVRGVTPRTSPQSAGSPSKEVAASLPTPGVSSAPNEHAAESVPAPASEAQAKATVMLAVSPWGEVYVDGKRVGVSPPLSTLQLEAGKHEVEIRNLAFAPYRKTVNLKSGQSLKIRHKFR